MVFFGSPMDYLGAKLRLEFHWAHAVAENRSAYV